MATESQSQQGGTDAPPQQQQQQGPAPPPAAAATSQEPDDDDNDDEAAAPLPPKHVQAAPGRRATRLQDLYAQALDHTLARLAWDNLAGCYPTVSRRAEPVLRQVQAQMVGKLGDKCAREFEAILASRGVVARLNELEGLVAEAAARKEAEGGSGDETPTP